MAAPPPPPAGLAPGENRYAQLLLNMPVGLVEHDANTRVLFANPLACQLLGLTPDQMLGKTAIDPGWCFLRRDGSALPVDEYPVNEARRATDGRMTARVLGIHNPARQEATWVQCSTYALHDASGDLQRIYVTFYSVTETVRAQEQVQAAARFTNSVIDSLPANICVLDEAGNVIAVNEGWRCFAEQNDSHTPLNGIGLNYLAVCDRALGPNAAHAFAMAEGIRDVLAGRKSQFELQYPCDSTSEPRWFLARTTQLDADGRKGAVVSHWDITRYEQAHDRLRASEALQSSVISALSEGLVVHDRSGRIVLANHSAADILGLATDDLNGRDSNDPRWRAYDEHGAPMEAADHPASITLQSGRNVDNCIMDVHVGDGRRAAISVNSRAILDTQQRLVGAAVTFVDITARRLLEERLRAS